MLGTKRSCVKLVRISFLATKWTPKGKNYKLGIGKRKRKITARQRKENKFRVIKWIGWN